MAQALKSAPSISIRTDRQKNTIQIAFDFIGSLDRFAAQ
jgi:hypothetical protein